MGRIKDQLKAATLSPHAVLALALAVVALLLVGSAVITPQTRPVPRQQQAAPARSVVTQPAEAASRETLTAASLGGKALPYRVMLPTDYGKNSRRYPVLYLLHGLTGNQNDWWERTRLTEYAARYHLIIVTPGVGDSWYANSATDQQARYEDAIINDLIPHIDSQYRTVANREGRTIAGLSMGGLGAVKFALRYPHLFSFAASFSGAFDVPPTARLGKKPSARMLNELRRVFGDTNSQTRRENDVFALLKQPLPKESGFPYLYVSTGKEDSLPQVFASNPRFGAALRARKIEHEYHERDGAHDWRFWNSEIELMLGRLCVRMSQICS